MDTSLMKSAIKPTSLSLLLTLCTVLFAWSVHAKNETIQFKSDKLTVDLGGKFNNETYFAGNMNFFNASVAQDSIFYIRSTFDMYSIFTQGDYETPRLVFYDTFRFRFKWGSLTDVQNNDSGITLSQTAVSVKGTATTKHLLWMREAWLKLFMGPLEERENYLQIGLIPFELGRGISLGTAYDTAGFLGFNPGASIDQYAPAVLLSFNPIPDRLIVDTYVALVENNQTSLTENLLPIHTHQLDASCTQRGLGVQSYIMALRSLVSMHKEGKENVIFEPYLMYQKAPNQDLEFTHDVNSYLSTAGLSIEGAGKRYSWGIEGARNFGELDVLPWDRNYTTITNNPANAELIENYTKVYISDPSVSTKPTPAPNTAAVSAIIAASPKNVSQNGKQIGVIPGSDPEIKVYNSFNRFRPAQVRYLNGYFFIADATYICILPKTLQVSAGVGYASGYIDQQHDVNTMTTDELMNQQYSGFLPLQSVYNGRRLRHLVLFNQGVPRFNTKLPNADLSQKNVTTVSSPSNLNQMTNIGFVGGRLDWNIQAWKKNGVNVGQNIICYWAPETAHFSVPRGAEKAVNNVPVRADALIPTQQADNFIGTELTTEVSALFYEKIKLSGYMGFFLPGRHYQDMAGTVIGSAQLPSGADLGYIGNFSVSYLF
jgi:hypothetical protein